MVERKRLKTKGGVTTLRAFDFKFPNFPTSPLFFTFHVNLLLDVF